MRDDYRTDGPGKYESVPPVVRWIDEHDVYDQTGGDVESPQGWYGRAGRWVVRHDERGAVTADRYPTRADASAAFNQADDAFAAWCDEPDPDTGELPDGAGGYGWASRGTPGAPVTG